MAVIDGLGVWWKITQVFGYQDQGWTESFWWKSPAPTSALNLLSTLSPAFSARATLLGKGASLTAVRISDINLQGDGVQFFDVSGWWDNKTNDGLFGNIDTAFLIRMIGGDNLNFRFSYYLKGTPNKWQLPLGPIQAGNPPDATFILTVMKWLQTLNITFQASKLVGGEKPPTPSNVQLVTTALKSQTNPLMIVTDITLGAGPQLGMLAVKTFGAPAVATGDIVALRGCKGLNVGGLNRRHKVQYLLAAPDTGFYIRIPTKWRVPYNLMAPPSAQKLTHQGFAVVLGIGERFVKKSTGRAFFVPRGRAPAEK